MTDLFPIIRRKRQPLANVVIPDAVAQLRAKCSLLEQDNEALRVENTRLGAELAARKTVKHTK